MKKSSKNTPTTKSLFPLQFEEKRKLVKEEYANLSKKVSGGFFNADLFRQNIFTPAARVSHKPYKVPKIAYENDKNSIAISHPLSQKHADILSLIYTENVSVTKPTDTGSYKIKIVPYRIAKAMGYKHPEKAAENVIKMIRQMRWTDFVLRQKGEINEKDNVKEFTILGGAEYNLFDGYYEIEISAESAKLLSYSVAISLDMELNKRIIAIPDNKVHLKSIVRYILANKKMRNGVTLEFFIKKFGFSGNKKTAFLKHFHLTETEIRKGSPKDRVTKISENLALLKSFGITYDDTLKKFKYDENDGIGFAMAVDPNKVLKNVAIEQFIGLRVEINTLPTGGGIIKNVEYSDKKDYANIHVEINKDEIALVQNVPIKMLDLWKSEFEKKDEDEYIDVDTLLDDENLDSLVNDFFMEIDKEIEDEMEGEILTDETLEYMKSLKEEGK